VSDGDHCALPHTCSQVFAFLTRADEASLRILQPDEQRQENCLHLIVEDGLEVFLPQNALVDRDKEMQRLQRQADKLRKDIDVLSQRLASSGFRDRAPKEVVQQASDGLRDLQEQLAAVQRDLLQLQ